MTTFEGLNTEEHERSIGNGNSILPQGFYQLAVVRNMLKQNSDRAKDPQGKYVEVEFDVISPQNFSRRKYWEKFNIVNKNSDAVRIGKEHLSDLVQALGITRLEGGTLEPSNPFPALMGKTVGAYLGVEKGSNGYADSNKCMKYLPAGSTQADYDAWVAGKKGNAAASGATTRQSWSGNQAGAPAPVSKPAWGNSTVQSGGAEAVSSPAATTAPWKQGQA